MARMLACQKRLYTSAWTRDTLMSFHFGDINCTFFFAEGVAKLEAQMLVDKLVWSSESIKNEAQVWINRSNISALVINC